MSKTPKLKWRYAIGTTSIVPGTNRREHYIICDVDERDISGAIEFIMMSIAHSGLVRTVNNQSVRFVSQQTKHGWHIFTNAIVSFRELCYLLRRIPGVDPAWISIGERRGYFFLADKDLVVLPWKVVRMQIHYEAKQSEQKRRKNDPR